MMPRHLAAALRSSLTTTATKATPSSLRRHRAKHSPSSSKTHTAQFLGGHPQSSSRLIMICSAKQQQQRGDGGGGGVETSSSDASVAVSIDRATKKKNTADLNLNLNRGLDPFSIDPAVESRLAALCDDGMPDAELCDLAKTAAPLEADFLRADGGSVAAEALTRGRWLLGLLLLQSASSFVLDSYGELLRDHIVVTLFLTMLVGAGGNAGNQSAIHVIRGLATGSLDPENREDFAKTMLHQGSVGALLASGLAVAGFARVLLSTGSVVDSSAISASLFLIVFVSVGVGSALPFALARLGVDPANAGTSVQVAMDILGCAISCATCGFVLSTFAGAVGAVAAG